MFLHDTCKESFMLHHKFDVIYVVNYVEQLSIKKALGRLLLSTNMVQI